MQRILRKFILFCLLLSFLMPVLPALMVKAAEKDTVRVGYIPDDAFFYMDKNGQYQGLYAEYLYHIAQYTGWDYEFISGSQDRLIDMLSNGQIDILLNINYTPERRALCYFSDYPITMQQLCFVVHPEDESFPDSDLRNLNGKKVGTIADTYSENVLLKLIDKKRLNCTYCPYSNYKSLVYAFTAGSVDSIILNISDVDNSQKILSVIDIGELYLAVSKLKPDILQQLNNTLKEIYLQNPFYNAELYAEYANVTGKNYSYSSSALKYIADAPPLRVVCLKDNAPFEYYDEDTRSCGGITGSYLNAISSRSGLSFEYIPVNSYTEALNMIYSGEADMIASLYADSVYAASHSLNITDDYYSLGLSLVRKNDTSLNLQRPSVIALTKNTAGTDNYLEKMYGKMSFKYYDTIKQCIESVRTGKTDAAILSSETASVFLQQHYYSDIVVSTGLQLGIPVSIGMRDDLPDDLMYVLNQTLKSIPSAERDDIQMAHMVQTTYAVSFTGMITANLIPLLSIIFGIVTLLIIVIVIKNRVRYRKILAVSQTDQLTGILNKMSAENRIRSYLKSKPDEICALYMLDIDHFKMVNDTFGHQVGDIIIHDTAQLIYRAFSEHDIVGRMGGDEFIMLQTGCRNVQDITEKARKLSYILNRIHYVAEKGNCELTASIGIMVYNHGNYTYEELVKKADGLLYEVKEAGRNSYRISQ